MVSRQENLFTHNAGVIILALSPHPTISWTVRCMLRSSGRYLTPLSITFLNSNPFPKKQNQKRYYMATTLIIMIFSKQMFLFNQPLRSISYKQNDLNKQYFNYFHFIPFLFLISWFFCSLDPPPPPPSPLIAGIVFPTLVLSFSLVLQ